MSKTFEVTAPDGHILEVTGPDDATEEQALAQAQKLYQPAAASPASKPGPIESAGSKFLGTLGGMASGVYHAYTDPATAKETEQFGNQPGPIELGLKRTLVDPITERASRIINAPTAKDKLLEAATLVPSVGTGLHFAQTAKREGVPAAIGEAGAIVAAPKIAEEISRAPETAANAFRSMMPSSESLDVSAAANKARALQPTTLQGKADAESIAAELSRRGKASGSFQSTIDRNVMKDVEASGAKVGAVEDRLTQEVRPEYRFDRAPLLEELNKAESALDIAGPGTTARPEAIGHIQSIRKIIEQLPEQLTFKQMLKLRRQLDDRAVEAGSFGVNADTLKADLNRGVANIVRGKLNAVDSELASANHDFSIDRKAADIVERRQLSKVGRIDSGVPSRGGILDDLLATWAGQAAGGPIGGAVIEGMNLARQTPGFANAKAAFQQRLANRLRPAPTPPAGLLASTAGGPHAMGMPETSGISVNAPQVKRVDTYDFATHGTAVPPNARMVGPTAADLLHAKAMGLSVEDYLNFKNSLRR